VGEIGDASGVDILAPLVEDGDARLRRMAVWALGEIETGRAVLVLAPAVRDSDRDVKLTALWALGQIEDGAGVDVVAPRSRTAMTTCGRWRHGPWARSRTRRP
jgi:HEAT repeat protein